MLRRETSCTCLEYLQTAQTDIPVVETLTELLQSCDQPLPAQVSNGTLFNHADARCVQLFTAAIGLLFQSEQLRLEVGEQLGVCYLNDAANFQKPISVLLEKFQTLITANQQLDYVLTETINVVYAVKCIYQASLIKQSQIITPALVEVLMQYCIVSKDFVLSSKKALVYFFVLEILIDLREEFTSAQKSQIIDCMLEAYQRMYLIKKDEQQHPAICSEIYRLPFTAFVYWASDMTETQWWHYSTKVLEQIIEGIPLDRDSIAKCLDVFVRQLSIEQRAELFCECEGATSLEGLSTVLAANLSSEVRTEPSLRQVPSLSRLVY